MKKGINYQQSINQTANKFLMVVWILIFRLVVCVVLKLFDYEETCFCGIILSSGAKEKPQVAEIIEVGPGGEIDGKPVKMYVKKGDRVIVSKYAGTEVKYEGEDYIIVKQDDILAIVE